MSQHVFWVTQQDDGPPTRRRGEPRTGPAYAFLDSLDLTGGFSSSPSGQLVSTWTSRWVSRRTLELKMAARLLQRRAVFVLSRYSLSSQDRGLHAKDSG